MLPRHFAADLRTASPCRGKLARPTRFSALRPSGAARAPGQALNKMSEELLPALAARPGDAGPLRRASVALCSCFLPAFWVAQLRRV